VTRRCDGRAPNSARGRDASGRNPDALLVAQHQLSIDKSRRVLRLALKWAADSKLIEASPAEPIDAPEAKTNKRAKKQVDAPAPEAKPTKRGAKKTDATPVDEPEKKPRKRRGAIVLEVAQPEAEAAADVAEAMVAESAS
jgi:hypothetical protein